MMRGSHDLARDTGGAGAARAGAGADFAAGDLALRVRLAIVHGRVQGASDVAASAVAGPQHSGKHMHLNEDSR